MFFAKTGSQNVSKIYLSLNGDALDLRRVMEEVSSGFREQPKNFCLNYLKSQSINRLHDVLTPEQFNDLEYLEISGGNGEPNIIISRISKENVSIRVFELMLVLEKDIDFSLERNLLKSLKKEYQLHYAYGRWLRQDFLPITESRIKKSIFGSVSVAVRKFEEGWLFDPSDIEIDAIKGVYPLNYWRPEARDRLIRFGVELSTDISIDGIYQFEPTIQHLFLEKNSNIKKFIHFNDE